MLRVLAERQLIRSMLSKIDLKSTLVSRNLIRFEFRSLLRLRRFRVPLRSSLKTTLVLYGIW
ncbi:hypothetical protein CKA32_005092 [Geitlerinema sp. FC II]|nr:hypothetical protein CKA32_005092 [Geitlerinema sp. FC II]